jgi:hypothetical protein
VALFDRTIEVIVRHVASPALGFLTDAASLAKLLRGELTA